MGAHHVAVELRHLPTRFEQKDLQDRRCRRLPRTAETCEPDAESLSVPRWIGFGQDLRRFRPREPCRKETALAEKLLAHLRARDGRRARSRGNLRRLLVSVLIREIEQLREGHHRYANLVLELP